MLLAVERSLSGRNSSLVITQRERKPGRSTKREVFLISYNVEAKSEVPSCVSRCSDILPDTFYHQLQHWNEIPMNIRELPTVYQYRKQLKSYLTS